MNFQRYETGFEPVLPSERDLDLMTEAFGNLYMMVRAVREDSPNPLFDELLKAPAGRSVWELDWSFLPTLAKDDDGRWTFPLGLLCVDQDSGLVLFSELLDLEGNIVNAVTDDLCTTMAKLCRPASIALCDDDLKAIVDDLCRKVGVKLSVKKRLPAPKAARDKMRINKGAAEPFDCPCFYSAFSSTMAAAKSPSGRLTGRPRWRRVSPG